MNVVLVFWLLIPGIGQNKGVTFHETKLKFASYSECMSAREHMITVTKLILPKNSQVAGYCYP